MTTREAIKKTFGNDARRLREFINLTEAMFATPEAMSEAKAILAEIEAGQLGVHDFHHETSQIWGWTYISFSLNGTRYEADAKIFDVGSKYGINGGRISKLAIKREKANYAVECVYHYDRGCDQPPTDPEAEEALQAILAAFPG